MNLLGIRPSPWLVALLGLIILAIALVNGRVELGIVGLAVLVLGGIRLLGSRGG